jgi:hypothetical protein
MMIAVHAQHVATIRGAKMLKVSVLEWMCDHVALVVRLVVAVPMVVVDVWN